jgi:hypothetical protein
MAKDGDEPKPGFLGNPRVGEPTLVPVGDVFVEVARPMAAKDTYATLAPCVRVPLSKAASSHSSSSTPLEDAAGDEDTGALAEAVFGGEGGAPRGFEDGEDDEEAAPEPGPLPAPDCCARDGARTFRGPKGEFMRLPLEPFGGEPGVAAAAPDGEEGEGCGAAEGELAVEDAAEEAAELEALAAAAEAGAVNEEDDDAAAGGGREGVFAAADEGEGLEKAAIVAAMPPPPPPPVRTGTVAARARLGTGLCASGVQLTAFPSQYSTALRSANSHSSRS